MATSSRDGRGGRRLGETGALLVRAAIRHLPRSRAGILLGGEGEAPLIRLFARTQGRSDRASLGRRCCAAEHRRGAPVATPARGPDPPHHQLLGARHPLRPLHPRVRAGRRERRGHRPPRPRGCPPAACQVPPARTRSARPPQDHSAASLGRRVGSAQGGAQPAGPHCQCTQAGGEPRTRAVHRASLRSSMACRRHRHSYYFAARNPNPPPARR